MMERRHYLRIAVLTSLIAFWAAVAMAVFGCAGTIGHPFKAAKFDTREFYVKYALRLHDSEDKLPAVCRYHDWKACTIRHRGLITVHMTADHYLGKHYIGDSCTYGHEGKEVLHALYPDDFLNPHDELEEMN